MSPCLFIHDFFQDGRLDVLAEIRILQVYGDWTKERRACWIKQAKAGFERSMHTHPHIPQGSSYYAGRIAGLKSAITAHYPTLDPISPMLFLPLPGKMKVICLECGDEASWKCHPDGSFHLVMYLCDRCKQERVRTQDALTTFGWDHNKRELIPLPVALKESEIELAKTIFPLGTLFACNVSNILWPTSHLAMLMELGIVLLVRWQSPTIARFFLFLIKLTEGQDA